MESQSTQDATPLSQRGSGQNALFATPVQTVQAAAQQVADRISNSVQAQQQAAAGNGAGNGNGGSVGGGNTGTAAINDNMSFADFMRVA